MPTFIIIDSNQRSLRKAVGSTIIWASDARLANTYPSKYAAKKHLRKLDNVPEDVKIIELVDVNLNNGDNLNG